MKFKIVNIIMLMVFIFLLTGCSNDISYEAQTTFQFTDGQGNPYSNLQTEFVVGQTIYLRLHIWVNSTSKDVSEVDALLTIPKIQNVGANYLDGPIIPSENDNINQLTKYSFKLAASESSTTRTLVFQFIPQQEGNITITLIFGDILNSSYDVQKTVIFVNGQ